MELLVGPYFGEWVRDHLDDKSGVVGNVRAILDIAWRLDQSGLDHGELTRIRRHYIVTEDGPRVIDFESYCKSIGVPTIATESITIELKDEMCHWNDGTYTITPNGTSLDVERTNKDAEIALTAIQLSKLISGQVPATMLRSFNEIHCDEEVATKLEEIFPADDFVSYMRF